MISTGDEVEIRRAGDRALLLLPGRAELLAGMLATVRSAGVPGVTDLLPAAETLMITIDADADQAEVAQDLRALLADLAAWAPVPDDEAGEVIIPVRYDGVDLEEVAGLLGLGVPELIAAHTGRVWRCRFVGFTAGFGYLESDQPWQAVPRRAQSRTAVPAGSVGLADRYSAVYPRRAPGGWQLIGTTDIAMWDLGRPQSALLAPGTRVRFVEADL
ncbi:allophanate hydrolase subunit 1 [Microlunatus sp. GCM10028923]|uniref:5-oxoprolinase subunit B family protein n=1 Tax=Microlunatus sp. GCM10028923 TaxID=3273400 RepID=UPI0036714DC6